MKTSTGVLIGVGAIAVLAVGGVLVASGRAKAKPGPQAPGPQAPKPQPQPKPPAQPSSGQVYSLNVVQLEPAQNSERFGPYSIRVIPSTNPGSPVVFFLPSTHYVNGVPASDPTTSRDDFLPWLPNEPGVDATWVLVGKGGRWSVSIDGEESWWLGALAIEKLRGIVYAQLGLPDGTPYIIVGYGIASGADLAYAWMMDAHCSQDSGCNPLLAPFALPVAVIAAGSRGNSLDESTVPKAAGDTKVRALRYHYDWDWHADTADRLAAAGYDVVLISDKTVYANALAKAGQDIQSLLTTLLKAE